MESGSHDTSTQNPVTETPAQQHRQPRRPPSNRRKPRPDPTDTPAGAPDPHKQAPRRNAPRRDNKGVEGGEAVSSKGGEKGAGKGKRPPKPRPQATEEPEKSAFPRPPGQGRRKGIKFGGQLTSSNEGTPASSDAPSSSKSRRDRYKRDPDPQEDDLTSNLIRALRNPPYADCPICFNSIHPPQPTWSCSPLTPIVAEEKAGEKVHDDHDPQYCWTTFHLKCIKSWSEKSYNDREEKKEEEGNGDVQDVREEEMFSLAGIGAFVVRLLIPTTDLLHPILAATHAHALEARARTLAPCYVTRDRVLRAR
ncbi:FKBP12-associated protein [Marasmius crinis-equi]|uniref:FKBP12-associated protein n=1 Tax=Marasmius crinis-equi TaxID=585013 RepID=A0ABR3EPV3_9AGAR